MRLYNSRAAWPKIIKLARVSVWRMQYPRKEQGETFILIGAAAALLSEFDFSAGRNLWADRIPPPQEQEKRGCPKALIFSQFVAEPFGVKRLARELREFRPLAITGGMDQAARSAAFDSLERDQSRRVMILSLRAGGTGLNLTAASRVIHFDRWWNPAVEIQAEDRVPSNWPDAAGSGLRLFVRRYRRRTHRRNPRGKRALFADLIDGVPASSLGRLDLDSLLRAAAPAF